MHIQAQQWLAAVFKCPKCGRISGRLRMPPTRKWRNYVPTCLYCKCQEELIERRYYTTFASDMYSCAGTCAKVGPFKVCDYVFRNITVFKQSVRRRQREIAKEAQAYFERQREIEAECEARRKKQQEEAALLKEVERIAQRRHHATELAAELIAQ